MPPNPKTKQPLPGATPALDAPDPSSSSSLLSLAKPKQVLPGSVSVADGDDPSASAGQGTGKGRPGAGTTPASAPAPKFRVLVCAQSNAAIDEVISRLASPGLLMGESVLHTYTPSQFLHNVHGVEAASQCHTKLMPCTCFLMSHSLHGSSLPTSAPALLYVPLAETATSQDYHFSNHQDVRCLKLFLLTTTSV